MDTEQMRVITAIYGAVGELKAQVKDSMRRLESIETEVKGAPARRIAMLAAAVSVAAGVFSCAWDAWALAAGGGI